MRKIISFNITAALLALSSSYAFAAPAKSPATPQLQTVHRATSSFDQISVNSNIHLIVNVGQPLQILIHATPQIAHCILTDVNNSTLYIHRLVGAPSCRHIKPSKLTINTPELEGINTHGITNVQVNHLNSRAFLSYSSGQSHLSLSGRANSINAVVSGEATVDAHNLVTKSMLVSASGNSRSRVKAHDSLFVRGRGNSVINYDGKPKKVIKSLSGNSTVQQWGSK